MPSKTITGNKKQEEIRCRLELWIFCSPEVCVGNVCSTDVNAEVHLFYTKYHCLVMRVLMTVIIDMAVLH